jgi:hypothetical protein
MKLPAPDLTVPWSLAVPFLECSTMKKIATGCWLTGLLLSCLLSASPPAALAAAPPSPTLDLPACEATVLETTAPLSVGVVQPHAAPDIVLYAIKLARDSGRVTVCSESWSEVLPRLTPLARHLERGYGIALYLLAMFLAVALLTRFTPRQQWRRTTVIGVVAVLGSTWLLALVLMFGFHALAGQRLVYDTVVSLRQAQQAQANWYDINGARELDALLAQYSPATPPASASASASGTSTSAQAVVAEPVRTSQRPGPQGTYHTFNRANLRQTPGVESLRLLVIPRGQRVTFDGAVDGDWWRIKMQDGQVGWVCSIFLRRLDEAVPGARG